MAWAFLGIAGLCEIAFTVALKYAAGFTRMWPSLAFIAAYAASAWFLSLAIRTIPVGTAYAVWTGIGAVGAAGLGIWLFAEPATAARLAFIALIVIGVAGLKLVSSAA